MPGFFLALARGAPRARPGFTRRVLAFTIPAGTVPLARRILALQLPPAGVLAACAGVVLAAIAALTLWRRRFR